MFITSRLCTGALPSLQLSGDYEFTKKASTKLLHFLLHDLEPTLKLSVLSVFSIEIDQDSKTSLQS